MNSKNNMLDLAIVQDYATEAHSGQYRKDGTTPYITHPIGVAKLVAKFGNDKQISIALLHDVIEDCEGYTFETIKEQFGEEIAVGVMHLTKISKEDRPELNRACRSVVENARLSVIPDDIKAVKLADIYYNVHDLAGMGGFAKRFLSEKLETVRVMMADHLENDIVVGRLEEGPKKLLEGIIARCKNA